MNQTLCAPPSEHYGKPCRRFQVSTLRMFNGKAWQLRTMQHRGQHFIVPFIINTGGVDSFRPIIDPQTLSQILGRPVDPACFDQSRAARQHRITIPSPLGELHSFSFWDPERADAIKRAAQAQGCVGLDLRYNLIGHGFAFFIRDVHAAALKVHDGRLPFDKTLEWLIADCPPEKGLRDYIQNPANRWRVERELSACVGALKDDDVPLDELARRWALETK